MNIFLNNHKINFLESDLPILIHGKEGSGASFFSIALIAKLFLSGSKILFFTAFSMAKKDFLNLIGNRKSEIGYIEKEFNINKVSDKQAIIIESGNINLFKQTIYQLNEIDDRTIFIKNIERYDKSIFELIRNKTKIIISGNIDRCQFAANLVKKKFHTKIFFSKPEKFLNIALPNLEKYSGYFIDQELKGIIKLEFSKRKKYE